MVERVPQRDRVRRPGRGRPVGCRLVAPGGGRQHRDQRGELLGRRGTAHHDGGVKGRHCGAGVLDVLMAVENVEVARDELLARGVDVSEVFHDVNGGFGGGFHIGTEGRASGPDPDRRSYASYASFNDTEGNRWILQELTTRFPGRV